MAVCILHIFKMLHQLFKERLNTGISFLGVCNDVFRTTKTTKTNVHKLKQKLQKHEKRFKKESGSIKWLILQPQKRSQEIFYEVGQTITWEITYTRYKYVKRLNGPQFNFLLIFHLDGSLIWIKAQNKMS